MGGQAVILKDGQYYFQGNTATRSGGFEYMNLYPKCTQCTQNFFCYFFAMYSNVLKCTQMRKSTCFIVYSMYSNVLKYFYFLILGYLKFVLKCTQFVLKFGSHVLNVLKPVYSISKYGWSNSKSDSIFLTMICKIVPKFIKICHSN